MKSRNCYQGINPIIVAKIRFYTQYLKSSEYFADEELEDIEQELLYQSWSYLSRYDQDKGNFFTFANLVIKGRASNLLNKQQCDKYSYKPFTALVDREYPIDELITRIDVESIISTLPKKLQNLCQQLKFFTPTEITQMGTMPRSTMYYALLKLRSKFKESL